MIDPMQLTGKHIIVTGASSGLGRATCITLSQLGATVSLIARNEEGLKETVAAMEPGNHAIWPFDVTKIGKIEDLVNRIVEKNGKADGFAHVAGVGTTRPLSMTKYDLLEDMMLVHFYSFVEFSRVLGKKKNTNDNASFVAVSTAGTKSADKGKTAYVGTKGALDAVVRPLAVELGESRKIRVNTVNPCWIKTKMYYDYVEALGQEMMDNDLKDHTLGAAEPEEVTNSIAFLLSNAASKITGQNIMVDSGASIQ